MVEGTKVSSASCWEMKCSQILQFSKDVSHNLESILNKETEDGQGITLSISLKLKSVVHDCFENCH